MKGADSVRHLAIPNQLIFDDALSPSAKRVFLALATYHWSCKGKIRKPIRFIAERAGVSMTTARTALLALERAGYIARYRRYKYSHAHACVVYAVTEYAVYGLDAKQDYTLIPYTIARQLLASHVTHATLTVFLGLACKQGMNNPHAYPSLRRLANDAGLAKSTVCLAIPVLSRLQFIAKNRCRNRTNRFSCNCYYVMLRIVEQRASFISIPEYRIAQTEEFYKLFGGPNFNWLPINNRTSSLNILRGNKNKVCGYFVTRRCFCSSSRDKALNNSHTARPAETTRG